MCSRTAPFWKLLQAGAQHIDQIVLEPVVLASNEGDETQIPVRTEKVSHIRTLLATGETRRLLQKDQVATLKGIILTVRVADLGEVKRWLIGFGAEATVLQPGGT